MSELRLMLILLLSMFAIELGIMGLFHVIGIAREDQAKLFTPLVQLDAGLARRHGGVGIGLAFARRLAELHSGTIEVSSEPGKGSTFTLRLPIPEEKT